MAELNILSVWPEYLHRCKQSPSRRFYGRALARRDDVHFHQTGPGFPDWDNDRSGLQNIERIMPDCDAILSYKAAGGCEFGGINDIADVARKVLVIEQFNECHSGTEGNERGELHPQCATVVQYAKQAHLGLLILHHGNDRPRVSSVESFGCRIAHIPHGADQIFCDEARPWSERSGILLTGALNPAHYALRCRIHKMIQEGKIPNATSLPRPPNYTRSVEESDALVRQYARALGSCRVKLGCSSRWRYALQHYSEAALAGCAHVADMPDEVSDDFRRMVMPIGPEISDDNLIGHIRCVHTHAQAIGEQAQAVAREHFTTAHYAERLVAEIRTSLAAR